MPTALQHGGFYFSCYLGSYFHENYQTTYPLAVPHLAQEAGVWQQIEIEGVSMHAAIADVSTGNPHRNLIFRDVSERLLVIAVVELDQCWQR